MARLFEIGKQHFKSFKGTQEEFKFLCAQVLQTGISNRPHFATVCSWYAKIMEVDVDIIGVGDSQRWG